MNASPHETRVDCHTHCLHSPDGRGTVAQIVRAAADRGLGGVAITDHNSVRSHADIRALKDPPVLVVPGIEVSTLDGHCLGLGVRDQIPAGRTLEDTIEMIHAAGGVAVPSHPRRRVHGVGRKAVARCADHLAAIEVYNAHDGDRRSHKAELLAIHHHLGGTGGSDAHDPPDVGHAYTSLPGVVDSVDDFVGLIEKGKTWGEGVPFPRGRHLRKNVISLGNWVKRGFRSI